jgi:hypothetical protein
VLHFEAELLLSLRFLYEFLGAANVEDIKVKRRGQESQNRLLIQLGFLLTVTAPFVHW